MIDRKCLNCGKNITNPRFCNSSCAATYNNKGRIRSAESKKITSESFKRARKRLSEEDMIRYHITLLRSRMKSQPNKVHVIDITEEFSFKEGPYIKLNRCIVCNSLNPRTGKTCSSKCQARLVSIIQSARLKDPEYRRKHNYGRCKRSWLETSFEEWLLKYNVSFKTEVRFFNKVTKKNYFVDFLFEDKKLIIELDGTQHRNTVERDSLRDKYLTSLGYLVVRIPHSEYVKGTRIEEVKLLLGLPRIERGP